MPRSKSGPFPPPASVKTMFLGHPDQKSTYRAVFLERGLPAAGPPIWTSTASSASSSKEASLPKASGRSSHPDLFLVSMKGTPLISTVYDTEGQAHLKDMVVQQWRRYAADLPIKLKNFRSIGATLLEEHPVYGRYASHFLGHSPKTVAGKHYVAPSQKNFDEALDWLRAQIIP